MWLPILLSLVSGLAGSVIGAVIGAWATLRSTEKSLKGLYQQELEKRGHEEKRQNRAVTEALLKELRENVEVATDVTDRGNYKVRMSRESWASYKGQTGFMPEKLQGNLPFAYHLISNFNGLVEYDLYKLGHGAGYLDEKIRAAADTFKNDAGGVVSQLQEQLAGLV